MKKIAILAYSPTLQWHPNDILTGVPGSEEAAIYTALELSRSFSVVVFGNPGKDEKSEKGENQNPLFVCFDQLSTTSTETKFDLVICWRRLYPQMKLGCFSQSQFYYWPHDGAIMISLEEKWIDMLSGVYFLSHYQRNSYIEKFPQLKKLPFVIGGNGILSNHFNYLGSENQKNQKIPYSCAYISNYASGLETLLEIWPQVKKSVPQASLAIYYGRETWGCISQERMSWIIKKIEEYEKKYNVKEIGKVGHIELAQALLKTSVWTYPCASHCNETFCISALKAQAAGCIPVTTRNGALQETVHSDAPSISILSQPEDTKKYQELLIQTLQRVEMETNDTESESERLKYRNFALKHTWKDCVDSWKKLWMHEDLCVVSAFLDIGRSEWKTFTRSVEHYIHAFQKYKKYNYHLVLYMDKKYVKEVEGYATTIIPIDEKWMQENIWAWKRLPIQEKIMKSKTYQRLTSHRRHFLEHQHPKYNLINCAKTDFLLYTMNNGLHHHARHLLWSDFGYFGSVDSSPAFPLDSNKLSLTQITVGVLSLPSMSMNSEHKDPFKVLNSGEVVITGSAFHCPVTLASDFQQLMHEGLEELESLEIADDDQHVMLRAYYKNPKLFCLKMKSSNKNWPTLLEDLM